MAENKIVGYKRIFGLILPDWVSEGVIRNTMVGILSSVVMLFLLIFLVWPNFETVNKKNSELATSKTDLETLKSSDQGLQRLKSDISDSDQQKILAAMPTQYSPDGAIYLLRAISRDTGVSIKSYSLPGGVLVSSTPVQGLIPGGEMVSFVAYPIKITVSAPVESLLVFISKIESSLPFGVVSDLNLQDVVRLSRSQNDKNVQLVMEINFYQSRLGPVNINKLHPLSEENLRVAKELVGYNYLVLPETTAESEAPEVSSTNSMFGF